MKTLRLLALAEARLIKLSFALVTGLLSSLLIYTITELLLFQLAGLVLLSPMLKLSVFLEAWAFSAFLVFRNTKSAAEILARSFLLGAAEWGALLLLGLLIHGTPILAASMTLFCLGGFAFTFRVERQIRQELSPRAHPQLTT